MMLWISSYAFHKSQMAEKCFNFWWILNWKWRFRWTDGDWRLVWVFTLSKLAVGFLKSRRKLRSYLKHFRFFVFLSYSKVLLNSFYSFVHILSHYSLALEPFFCLDVRFSIHYEVSKLSSSLLSGFQLNVFAMLFQRKKNPPKELQWIKIFLSISHSPFFHPDRSPEQSEEGK